MESSALLVTGKGRFMLFFFSLFGLMRCVFGNFEYLRSFRIRMTKFSTSPILNLFCKKNVREREERCLKMLFILGKRYIR
jgi:hypothetical protein